MQQSKYESNSMCVLFDCDWLWFFFVLWRLLTDSEASFSSRNISVLSLHSVDMWPRAAPSVPTAEFSTSARYFVFVAALWCLIFRRLFIRLSSSALRKRTCFANDKRLGVSRASRQHSQRRRLSGGLAGPTAAAEGNGRVDNSVASHECFLKGSSVHFVTFLFAEKKLSWRRN